MFSSLFTQAESGEVPHPLDVNYELLKARLTHLDKKDAEYAVIEHYLTATGPKWRKLEIMDVWAVDRQTEVTD